MPPKSSIEPANRAPLPGLHPHSILFLSLASIVLAALSTVVAAGLVRLIGLVTNLCFYQRFSFSFVSPAENHLGLAVVLVPTIGGVIIGLMAKYGSPAIRGHGIPEAMEQILQNRSKIAPIVTFLKPISAAISIGTGGPFGAEGPIIATGGALGSMIGQIFSTTANERKTLLAAGAAAGMTAIFGTPVAAVLLAVELLLFEFDARSLVPVAFASATAAGVRVWFFGTAPAFAIPTLGAASPEGLLLFTLLGGLVGIASIWVSNSVYWVEEQFERLPVHWMWWPAIGAVAVGLIGWFEPRTLGVGYDNIEDIVSNRLSLGVVAALCAAKFVSWAISLGSGTSGGTLAPLLTLGGGIGILLGSVLQHLFPAAGLNLCTAGLVGMAAIFSGASRALLASVIFAYESTRQPDALPALLAGATGAFVVSHFLMRHTIMTAKIAHRGVSVPHAYEADPLRHTAVAEVMCTELQTIPASMPVTDLARLVAANDPSVRRHQASLLVHPDGSLAGIVTRGDLLRAIEGGGENLTVLEAGTGPLTAVAYPDETVYEALAKTTHYQIGRLPVVDRADPKRIVGYLGRAEILSARAKTTEEETVREPGWLSRG